MKKSIIAITLFSLLTLMPVPATAGSKETVKGEFEATITWIVDGDSIRFKKVGSRSEIQCRMLHYNAPEMTGPERTEGRRALRKLMSLLKRNKVLIWGVDRDRYGRLLCEVRLLDGTYINDLMREFLKDYPKRDIYRHKEKGQSKRPEPEDTSTDK